MHPHNGRRSTTSTFLFPHHSFLRLTPAGAECSTAHVLRVLSGRKVVSLLEVPLGRTTQSTTLFIHPILPTHTPPLQHTSSPHTSLNTSAMPLARPSNAKSPVLSHFSLDGKVAAVTGGARGIGLEVVRGLAEAGAKVAFTFTSSKNAEEVAAKISKETGSEVKAYRADVKNKEEIAETLERIAKDFGKLDM